MMYKKYIILSASLITLQSCVATHNMDYYSEEAYAERGAASQDIMTPAYTIPQQPAMATVSPMQNQGLQMQQQAYTQQQQAYALNNTNNHSSDVSMHSRWKVHKHCNNSILLPSVSLHIKHSTSLSTERPSTVYSTSDGFMSK